jgi:hypothetical protein
MFSANYNNSSKQIEHEQVFKANGTLATATAKQMKIIGHGQAAASGARPDHRGVGYEW